MATNDFKPFATGGGANVVSQSAYASDTTLIASGFVTGVAESNKLNKVWRQATFVAAAIAQIIVDGGVDALDNGDLTTFKNNFLTRLTNVIKASVLAALASSTGYMLIRDTKSAGTDGGSASVGDNVRTLNTVDVNTIVGASLSASQITLPAGTYRLRGVCTSFGVKWSQGFFYNVTNGAEISRGLSSNGSLNTDADPIVCTNEVIAYIVLASPKVIDFRMYAQQNKASTGLGKAVGAGTEVYSIVEVEKLA